MKTKLLNIRFLATTVFLVFAFMLSGQDDNSLVTKFYEAIERNDQELAIQYGEQLIKTTNEVDDDLLVEIKFNLSMLYGDVKDFRKAAELGSEAIEILKRTKGTDNLDYAKSLEYLAMCYSLYGNYAEAVNAETEAKEIYKKIIGVDDPEYTRIIIMLAGYNSSGGNYAEAIRLVTEAKEIFMKNHTTEDLDYLEFPLILAKLNATSGNYTEAVRHGTEVMEIYKKKHGADVLNDKDYAYLLHELAGYNSSSGNFREALKLETEAMEICKKNYSLEDPNYAASLHSLAQYQSNLGNYVEAIELESEAMEIYKKKYGTENKNYATSLNNLAEFQSSLGNYTEAKKIATEALEIRKKIIGTDHPEYAFSLHNLASYNLFMGNYDDAIALETEALDIFKKNYGVNPLDYAKALNNLATIHSYLGNYGEAIRLGTRAVDIQKKILSAEHIDYATSLLNLAKNHFYLGNYNEAVSLGTEVVSIFKEKLKADHPNYAISLGNLAKFYYGLGNYSEAVRLGNEAAEILKNSYDAEHPEYATSLNNLAQYQFCLGNYDEAVRLSTEVIEIQKRVLGTEHPEYATSLNNLAYYHSALGNYIKAAKFATEATDVYKKTIGIKHPNYAISLSNLAFSQFGLGNYADFNKYMIEYVKIKRNSVINNFSKLTSQQRQHMWQQESFPFLSVLPESALLATNNNDATCSMYDNSALFSKGLLLTADTEMRKLILESGDEQALSKFEELQETRAWLGKLYETPVADRQVSTDSLERVAERQEAELVQMSAAYGDFMRNLKLTWKDVQAKLGDKDIAIEFLSFPLMYTDSTMYIALTLKKGYDNPRMIPLFELQQLKDIKTSYYKSPELSTMLWGKLADELDGVQNVYFSPSGELYNIGIESMPDYNGSGSMLNERFNFYRLSSTRELATTKRDAKEASGATIYGGINYNTDVAHMGTPHKEDDQIYAFNRSFDADSSGLRGSKIGSLAGTLEESNKIDSILTAAHVQVDKLTGDNATETSLKNMSGKHKRIMHIATHGFYWSESEAEKTNTQKQLKFLMLDNDDNPRYVEDKAMTRSGLLFCGAQNTFNGDAIPEGVDDGVLTAQEISQIDLRGLDLLVLSACQTGLGEISGDGVFGLQRGFKKAGAQTIVMSLWKVNDAATRDLMVQFYTGLADGLTKRQAFLKAQQYLKDHDKTYPYTSYKMSKNPHWAAFILLDALQ